MTMYVNVAFPLKLHPLTYKTPSDAPSDLTGCIVRAPLANRSAYGVVVEVADDPPDSIKNKVREILSIHGRFGSKATVPFLKWLCDYYLTPMGMALKTSFFEDTVSVLKPDAENRINASDEEPTQSPGHNILHPESLDPSLSTVCKSIKEKEYRSYLFHAQTVSQELSLLCETINKTDIGLHGAIIIVPEIGQIEKLSAMLKETAGDRLCLLHSKLTKKKRKESIEKIIFDEANIILGTRSAIFAPIKKVSFIAALAEHSQSYKGEEGLRYNGRDVAVMRGFLEGSPVLLSSVCPSLESVYNLRIGKYTQLQAAPGPETASQPTANAKATEKRARIKIINIRGMNKKGLSIHPDVLKNAREILSRNERFLFLVSRKGYSLIRCEDCGHILSCSKCRLPVVFHRERKSVKCHYCGDERTYSDGCLECGGDNTGPLGTGTERVKEEVEKILETEALVIEKTAKQPKADTDRDVIPFVIGTPNAARGIRGPAFSAAALLNPDMLLAQPDFRVNERVFQEVIQLSQTISPEGRIFIQTSDIGNMVWKFVKTYEFSAFYEYELSQRSSLDYPPFSRIIVFNVLAAKMPDGLLSDIHKIITAAAVPGADILGPVEKPSGIIQILLKSKNRKLIHATAKKLLDKLQRIKEIKISIDVDPYRI